MKYWTRNDYDGILLKNEEDSEDEDGRVLVIEKDDGQIVFREMCHGYFTACRSKQEAIECLKEAIAWIENS